MSLLYITPLKKITVAPYTPNSIPGITVWLDPTDNATITTSLGKATQWNDKSGNANNVAQALAIKQLTPTASAINGLQAMLCNQSLNNMHGTLSGGALATFSAFAIVQAASLAQFNGIICSSATTGDFNLEIGSGSNTVDIFQWGVGSTAGGGTVTTATTYCIGMVYSPGAGTVYINNVAAGTTTVASRHLGSTFGVAGDSANSNNFNGWAGYFGDLVVFNTTNSTDRNNLYNNYLKPKWNLP